MNKPASKPFTHSRQLYYGLLALWFVVNLFQSYFTELLHDEAYYWFYSTDLAWGYYDHPPMIALLIRLGYSLFPDELGVRLWIAVMSVGTLMMIVEMARVKNYFLFFVFVFSIVIFQAGGFIAVPDTPLIFFATLFFYAYQKYLKENKPVNAFLLVIGITGMLYSKYFGGLVIVFTLISNVKIVKRRSFWYIVIFSMLLMVPHLIWQIHHDFINFYFYLVERGRNSYFDVMNIINYPAGQLVIMNPLMAFFLLYYAFKNKPASQFHRALVYNIIGVFGLGFLLSFFGPVEANWTVTAYVPLILLAYPVIENKLKIHKAVYILGGISIGLILALRVFLVSDFLQVKDEPKLTNEFHGWKTWALEIKKIAGDRPVVFANSYQKASKYLFYAKRESFTFNYLLYRKNQFDLAGIEPKLADKEVLFVYPERGMWLYDSVYYYLPDVDSTFILGKWWYYTDVKHYRSYNYIPVKIKLDKHVFRPSELIRIPVEIINPLDSTITIKQDGGDTWLAVAFTQKGKVILYKEVEDISLLWLNKKYDTFLLAETPAEPGDYHLRVCIRSGWLPPGLNSKVFKVKIE
ncbi:MAG: glycosyltransferase family 39 protein [Chlorobi bacterium]|nr:glycosyltransferase family 39 protein [Chlorobiota bacterium]